MHPDLHPDPVSRNGRSPRSAALTSQHLTNRETHQHRCWTGPDIIFHHRGIRRRERSEALRPSSGLLSQPATGTAFASTPVWAPRHHPPPAAGQNAIRISPLPSPLPSIDPSCGFQSSIAAIGPSVSAISIRARHLHLCIRQTSISCCFPPCGTCLGT
jgi:hypothetical protein